MGNLHQKFGNAKDAILRVAGEEVEYRALGDASNGRAILGIFKMKRTDSPFGMASKEHNTYHLRVSITDVPDISRSDTFIVNEVEYSLLRYFNNGTGLIEAQLAVA